MLTGNPIKRGGTGGNVDGENVDGENVDKKNVDEENVDGGPN